MGYDIHAHAPDQDASLLSPDLSLNLQQHQSVFASPSVSYAGYSLLPRMRDFFADAAFSPGDIGGLVAELETLDVAFADLQQKQYVAQIRAVCTKAAAQGIALTCLCD